MSLGRLTRYDRSPDYSELRFGGIDIHSRGIYISSISSLIFRWNKLGNKLGKQRDESFSAPAV